MDMLGDFAKRRDCYKALTLEQRMVVKIEEAQGSVIEVYIYIYDIYMMLVRSPGVQFIPGANSSGGLRSGGLSSSSSMSSWSSLCACEVRVSTYFWPCRVELH